MTAGPDLIVRDFHFDSIYWVAGNVLTWSWVAENQGDVGAFTTTMGVYLSTDDVITPSDTLLVTDGATGFMFPGDVQDVARPGYTVDVSIAPGTYYVGVYIDPQDFRVESDETNNASNVIQVTVSAQPLGVDFIATGLEFGSYVWEQGDNVSVDWHLINQGDATSPSVQSSLYLSTDPIVDTNDMFVGSDPVSGMMSPGENNMETITNGITVPGLAPGVYYAAIFADNLNQTAEIDESNNWSEVVQIQVPAPATNGDDVIDMSLSTENENVSGLDGNDSILTGSGNDILDGGLGDDLLSGGPGADILTGGGGSDAASYLTATGAVTVDLQTPGSNTGDAAGDIYFQISNVAGSLSYSDMLFSDSGANILFGGGGDDKLYGRAGNDSLIGAAGNDLLHGGSGDDNLNGGDGNDILVGGVGADAMDGGAGQDEVRYHEAGMGLKADLVNSAVNTGDAAGDTYSSVEDLLGSNFNDTLSGDDFANVLSGNAGNDTINGRGGADQLNGGDGDDNLIGGAGIDHYNGGNGIDRVQYQGSSTGLRVDLQMQATNTGEAAGETFTLIEDIVASSGDDLLFGDASANKLYGFDGVDRVFGRQGNDTLFGGNGDDILNGGAGNDFLVGGADVDTFRFDGATFGSDRIVDFTLGETIDLQFYAGLAFTDLTIMDVSGRAEVSFYAGEIVLTGIQAADVMESWFDFAP
jgi:Ca2+-binding RTX toxin-like protein